MNILFHFILEGRSTWMNTFPFGFFYSWATLNCNFETINKLVTNVQGMRHKVIKQNQHQTELEIIVDNIEEESQR